MLRLLPFCVVAVAAVCLGGSAFAQDAPAAWPAYAENELARGQGFYLAVYKMFLLLLPFWLWCKTTPWIADDVEEFGSAIKQSAGVWNPVVVFTFLGTFVLLGLTIPIFAAGYALVVIAWVAPLLTYLLMRDPKVPEDRRVLTGAGLARTASGLFGKNRKKREEAPKNPWEMGPPVDLSAVGPLQNQNQAAMIEARQSPAYIAVKMLFSEAIRGRAEKIRLDFTADACAARYMVDGVWLPVNPKVHEKEPLNRPIGDAMLLVIKRLAQVNPQDRRSQQKGKFQTAYEGNKYDSTLLTQGTPTGEVAMVSFALITKNVRTLEELGMREKMRDQLKELLAAKESLIVVSSLPGDGLSATWLAALKSTDRLLRDFVSVEDVQKREPELENIDANKYDSAKGETPEGVMPKLILKQPEVFLVPEISSGPLLDILTGQIVKEERAAIVSIRAREAVEALVRLISLKPDVEQLVPTIKAVLNQRLIRKLCETCREAVPLSPELAQRLRIPPGRVQFLYREKQPPPPGHEPPKKKGEPEICPKCRGLGYFGRTAIYELLIVTDELRQALLANPKVEVLRQIAARGGHPSLQEEGILLVAAGVTSLTELQRVLKG
jgi:type II secretory ATPase GspE/PulE/Tfp pilus assembly ATPase PilB-like protein